jgi:NTE family protein
MTTRALVLGGGGPVGIAWETGLIAGLAESGLDLRQSDWILGTSAGSVVGAQLAMGRDPAAMLRTEFANAERAKEAQGATGKAPDLMPLMNVFARRPPEGDMPVALMKELGQISLNGQTVSEEVFIAGFGAIADLDQPWPERYACTAVDTETGEFVVWSRDTAAPLGRGVASSCSVPAIFPAITIDGRRYMDGGMRSGTNADLARDHGKVIIVAVMPPAFAPMMLPRLEAEAAAIRAHGGEALLLVPDAACGEAFGSNLMDSGNREAIARAGFAQGQADAARVGAFWN